MKGIGFVLAWIGAGIAAVLVMVWAFPRAYPLFPRAWEVGKEDAEVLGLEGLLDLAPLPENAYVVTRLAEAGALERRLQGQWEGLQAGDWAGSELIKDLLTWEVTVWAPGARAQDWSHRARLTPTGEVRELLIRVPPEVEANPIALPEARALADRFLVEQGVDVSAFGEPEIRTRESPSRTDTFFRYRHGEALLGEAYPYGIEVAFAGDRLAGFSRYYDDPELTEIRQAFQPIQLLVQAKVFLPLVLLPLMAIPFVRRYHAGEIGVRRGVQISAVVFACGVVSMLFSAGDASANAVLGVLSRRQVSLVTALQMVILLFFPMGLLSFLSWSVGESLSRQKHSRRLAAFDAIFQGRWNNATVARASLRGLASGLLVGAVVWSLLVGLRELGIWPQGWLLLGPWWESSNWFSIPLLTFSLAFALYTGLFGRLFLISLGEKLAGVSVGVIVSIAAAVVLFFGSTYVYPFSWNLLVWAVPPAAYAFLFLRYGVFTSVIASLASSVAMSVFPFLQAGNPGIQAQAALALVGVSIPLIVSAKSLLDREEFVYRYEDIPPHVRRIAERERQRVELETARGIQSSILPDLPARLSGVELGHRYLPATEVGGDFYDVLQLPDGRLAVAVGDVAGHGVSSGLVMSMVKSALTVQVSFEPEVESVFATLNRMVFRSARKRLLATLCYALLDPRQRELHYASAGHLFPYRLRSDGRVEALESVCYPLGVREELAVRVEMVDLEPGDVLFLFSDGVVEAHAEGSDELFGFERLEASLNHAAGASVDEICELVLGDLERFTGSSPRQDDLTLLVLRIP